MPASIRLSENADFSNAGLGMIMPATGMQVFSYFGGDASASTKNYAPSGADLSVVGSPTFGSNYIDCKSWQDGEGYLDTGLSEPDNWTVLLAVEPVEAITGANRAGIFGNLNNGGTGAISGAGMSIEEITSGNPNLRMRLALGNGSNRQSITLTPADMYKPTAWVASAVKGGRMALRNMTEGTIVEDTDVRATPQSNSSSILIGSVRNGLSLNGRSRLYAAAFVPRELTDAEIQSAYRQVQRALASRGVTV